MEERGGGGRQKEGAERETVLVDGVQGVMLQKGGVGNRGGGETVLVVGGVEVSDYNKGNKNKLRERERKSEGEEDWKSP